MRWVAIRDIRNSSWRRESIKGIADLKCGEVAEVEGVVSSVITLPSSSTPKFKFEVSDSTGVICVTFLGRLSITGIDPGTQIRLSGRVSRTDKRLTMFNPKYTLIKE